VLHAHFAALALAATTLAVSGCGGSSKAGSTTTARAATAPATTASTTNAPIPTTPVTIASGKPLTRAQWIARGDAICARTNMKLKAISVVSTRDYARVLPQAAIYDRIEATELSKLVPPASMARDWMQIVNGYQLFGDYTSRVAEYAQANNFAPATPLTQMGEKVHKHLAAIAKRDGFKQCPQE
jgi:hypothetical protein